MYRRDLLAGLGSLAVLGGGTALTFGQMGGSTARIEPVELETLDAPGSTPGTVTVPQPRRVTFLELFATWCSVCQSMMPRLRTVHEAVGDQVQFVSVTNEPLGNTVTRDDVADWWSTHDGNWTVAADTDLTLTQRLDARAVPTTVVFDERNRVVWKHRGRTTATELENRVKQHL